MKVLFSIAIGSALITAANAQLQAPPPITTAPPPAVPNPGVAVGVTGGRTLSTTTGSTVGRPGTNLGFTTPFPAVVPPNTPLFPEPIDPLEVVLESDMIRMLEQSPPPTQVPAQGRPGGLGVTITGGSTNPPPTPNVPVATNAPPATNAVSPPGAAGTGVANPTYP